MQFRQPAYRAWPTAFALLWAWGCASPGATSRSPTAAAALDSTPLASTPVESDADPAGLLLMAHGGGPEWNDRVKAAVAGLRDHLPVAVAFGMADPRTLQESLDSLHASGVSTVAVVRLFISGDARILLDRQGLAGSDEAGRILLAPARASSSAPARTGALLIAHGMWDEHENNELIAAMEDAASALRGSGFAEVRVATLREDWAEARAGAEREIRTTVSEMATEHSAVVVIPYRVFGFGPYAEVLDGLDYVPTDGLLPHPLVTEWISRRASSSLCAAGLPSPLGACDLASDPNSATHAQTGSSRQQTSSSREGDAK